jgi:hypothetical protein
LTPVLWYIPVNRINFLGPPDCGGKI